ncbi:MAG: V4R domain-containing protein [Gemmatimonadaceae bacterium]
MNQRPPPGVVAMPREVLHLLLDLPGEADMETLRAVGDAGGGALLDAFARWSGDGQEVDLADLPVDAFRQHAAEFFEWCGLGEASVFTRSDSLIEVTIGECWETARQHAEQTGCHLTTGLLHGFFAALAGYELGVMELECAGLGSGGTCRFVVGTPEMVDSIYAGLSSGASYDEIVGAAI